MNDILTLKESILKDKIQELIHYCLNCQARDSGDWIWVQGERYGLENLFNDFNVSEKLRDKIVVHLSCQNCGTQLYRWDEVGLEDKYDREIGIYVEKAKKKFGKKIQAFKDGINKFPTLSLQYSLAKIIYKELKNRILPTCYVEGIFFRARKVNNQDVLKSEDFLAPPIGKSEEGRFNHAGQSHFYLAERKETAIYECILDERPILLWLQEFKFRKISNILDLTFDWDRLSPSTSTLLIALYDSKILMESQNNKEMWKPDYNITRFIMDCAKHEGFNGIKYNSVKDPLGKNLVLFDCNKDYISNFLKPEIIIYNPTSEKKQFEMVIKEFEINDF